LRFTRHFEGTSVLEPLLRAAGSLLTVTQVVNTMRQAQTAGETPASAIPRLFEGEPRFPDPATAARFYGNLLGLWDLLANGEPLEQDIAPPLRPIQRRPQNAHPPPPFPEKGPDRPWVDACFAYLEGLDKSRLDRLQHSFEHRQDAVLGCLEEHNLTDDGFDTARQLLFELFAMIGLGWPPGIRAVSRAELEGGEATLAPEALRTYAEEVLFEAKTDEKSPLAAEEISRLRILTNRVLGAMWKARKAQ